MQRLWLGRWQLRALMFSQLCYRGFKFLEMWHCVKTPLDCLTHEGGGIPVFWNAGSHSTNNTMSHPRRCEALGYFYWTVEGIPVLWFIAVKQKLFLTCMHSLLETCVCPQQADSSVSFELIFFKLFRPGKIFEGACLNSANLRRNSFTCGKPSLVASHFWLFQWRLQRPL